MRRLKYIIFKTLYFIFNPFRKLYWFIFRPKTRGVKCLVFYEGKILLVRLNYAHKSWTVPGGGVDRGESFAEAAKREIQEEVGISLKEVTYVGEYLSTWEHKMDTVQLFYSNVDSAYFKIDGMEIAEAAWFSPSSLPNPRVPRVDKIIEMYKTMEVSSSVSG